MARSFNLRWHVWVLLGVAWQKIMRCYFEDAERDAMAALQAGQDHSDQSVVSISPVVLSDLFIHKGDRKRALQFARLAIDNTPTPVDQVLAAAQLGHARCLVGDLEGGIQQVEPMVAMLRQSGFVPGLWWAIGLSECLLLAGRPVDARDLLLDILSAKKCRIPCTRFMPRGGLLMPTSPAAVKRRWRLPSSTILPVAR